MDQVTRERIAMLCDELLRRRVPRSVVQHVIDWLDAQQRTAPAIADYNGHQWFGVPSGRAVCRNCGDVLNPLNPSPCTDTSTA